MDTSTRRQAGGGLWNCPKRTQYSRETQDMLKLMMQESRLTNFQQRHINERLRKGAALPLTCNPTSSAPPPPPPPQIIKPGPERLSAKPQKRSAVKCSSGDNYTRDRFRPSATRDLEKEKRRLQNILATGQEEPGQPRKVPHLQGQEAGEEQDRFQEVLDEIEERKQFLEEVTALGKGKNYYNIINTEISQKIRELEMIDKARSTELKTLTKKVGSPGEQTGSQDLQDRKKEA